MHGEIQYIVLWRLTKNSIDTREMKRNIKCFQQIWTESNIFGRLQGNTIKWNVTPHQEFLPKELGAWTVPPIRINQLSPSLDVEAEFTARSDFPDLVDEFLRNIGNTWQPSHTNNSEDNHRDSHDTLAPSRCGSRVQNSFPPGMSSKTFCNTVGSPVR